MLQVELDAIPHVLIAVRGADDSAQVELPSELSSAVQVSEEQVGDGTVCMSRPHQNAHKQQPCGPRR